MGNGTLMAAETQDGDETRLPEGWAWATLEQLAGNEGVASDGDWVESKDQDASGSVRLTQLADVGEMEFLNRSRRFMDEGRATEMNCLFLKEGDVLVSRLGDPLGKACLVPNLGQRAVTAVDVMVFRPGEIPVDARYVAYAINYPRTRQAIHEQISGTTRKRVTGKKLKQTRFPLAPLAEQRRIVSRIDELFSRIEAGERAIAAARVDLKRYRKAVLKAAVTGALTEDWRATHKPKETGEALLARILKERRVAWEAAELAKLKAKGKPAPKSEAERMKLVSRYEEPIAIKNISLPDIPKGWSWVRCEQTTQLITKGTTPSRELMKSGTGDVPYIKVYNLGFDGKIDFSINPTFIDRKTHEGFLARSRLYPGDVVMNIVGPPLGQVGKIPPTYAEWNTNQAVALFRPISGLEPDYLVKVLLTDAILQHALKKAKATVGQINLTLEICRDLPIPLPPADEQAEIVSRVEEALSRADAAEVTLDAQTRAARALKQSILKAAFSGRLVPQDPNDEPASELLKRVAKHNGEK